MTKFAIGVCAYLLACMQPAPAAAPPSPVDALAGRYSLHFPNGLVSGETYESDDVAEIVPVGPDDAYIRISLQFYNGHMCDISGIAHADGGGLVYHQPPAPENSDTLCVLRVSHAGADLLIDDGDGTCKSFCGARGSLSRDTLPFKSRRPIRYMAILKASSDYKDALKAWRGNR